MKYILHNSKTIRLHVCIKVCINLVCLYLQITFCVSTTLIAILGYRFEKSLLTFFWITFVKNIISPNIVKSTSVYTNKIKFKPNSIEGLPTANQIFLSFQIQRRIHTLHIYSIVFYITLMEFL